jgi:UDP-N-acetylmuramoyl-tripeptide--D-alanyl-D-alanine ligase
MTVLWTAQDAARATDGAATDAFSASGVSIDTRSLRPGDLFVALQGDAGDGHDHVAAAFAAGAAAAMVHRPMETAGPLLRVADTLAGLTALGKAGRARFAGKVLAVTGSVGKTSTKEMLRTALAALGPVHAAEASYNNHWGVPLTLARLPMDARFCVAEIGMNHPGEILPLARLVAPHAAIITRIGSSHLGHMGSIEAIAAEKASIFHGLCPGGVAVLPAEHATRAPPGLRVLRFGDTPDLEACLLDCTGDATGSDVTVRILGETIRFRLGAAGRHMAMNAVAGLAALAGLDLDVAGAANGLAQFAALGGRGALRPILGGTVTLLDESYNASPESVRAALTVLAVAPGGRRVAVLGDMLELGADGPALHAGLATDVAATVDKLFACGPQMRGLFDAVPAAIRGTHAVDSAALAPLLRDAVAPGDVVLVKGSLGSRMRLIVHALEHGLEQG